MEFHCNNLFLLKYIYIYIFAIETFRNAETYLHILPNNFHDIFQNPYTSEKRINRSALFLLYLISLLAKKWTTIFHTVNERVVSALLPARVIDIIIVVAKTRLAAVTSEKREERSSFSFSAPLCSGIRDAKHKGGLPTSHPWLINPA